MKSKQIIGSLLLLITAIIWGTAFVAQKLGLDYLPPCTYNSVRSFIGAIALIPCIAFLDVIDHRKPSVCGKAGYAGSKHLLLGGACCGIILGIASCLQQYGIAFTTVGKSGFITTLYIIIVPFLGIFFKRKVGWLIWLSAIASIYGMYLLCYHQNNSQAGECTGILNFGDIMLCFCALAFSFHILVIDHFAPKADCVRMSCIQFFVAGIVSFIGALLFEEIEWSKIPLAYKPLLYSGIMSSGVAYTLQVVSQKNVHPVLASLLMSLESVFASLSGWLFLNENMTSREIGGCIIIFSAVILAQIPMPETKKS